MKMYTKDGREVFVVRQIEGGYLVKEVYNTYSSFDDEGEGIPDEESFTTSDSIVFFEELYENAPTEKYSAEVARLQKEAAAWQEKIQSLQLQAHAEQQTLGKIAKIPILKKLADYLTKEFEYIVYFKDLSLKTRGETYNTQNVGVTIDVSNVQEIGWAMRMLGSSYSANNEYDKYFLPFSTKEDALAYIKEQMLLRIKKFQHSYWNELEVFENMFKDWNNYTGVKADSDVVDAYNEKHSVLLAKHNAEKAKKLQEEIDNLEKKREELKKIQS